MGRKQRRLEERKNRNKKNIERQEELNYEIKGVTILKVVSTIILLVLVLYYILAVFITKEIDISETKSTDSSENNTTSESISDKIVATNIFSQKEDLYYVYCYDFSDEDEGVAQAVQGASSQKIYRLNTKDGFNSKYVTDGEGNKNASSLSDLKISNPTLLVISGDKITGYYEGRTSIINFLGEQS